MEKETVGLPWDLNSVMFPVECLRRRTEIELCVAFVPRRADCSPQCDGRLGSVCVRFVAKEGTPRRHARSVHRWAHLRKEFPPRIRAGCSAGVVAGGLRVGVRAAVVHF